MIVKSTRIPTAHTSRIASYLADPSDNETSTWIRGCPEDLLLLGEISRILGRQYAVRHFVIAPAEPMSQQDFISVFAEICFEYGVSITSGNRCTIVEHVKPRASGFGNETHWHVTFPEHDVETGRVMSSRFYKMRNEKVARLCELKLGHAIIPGQFNQQVYRALKKERPNLDLAPFESALKKSVVAAGQDESFWQEFRASTQHQSRSMANQMLASRIM